MKMTKSTTKNKYFVPVLLVVVLVASLVLGVLYIRSYTMKLTVQERTYQLEEMISQIRVNLDSGLKTHWNIVSSIESEVLSENYPNEKALTDSIGQMEKRYRTDLYDSRIMLLDNIGTAYLRDGSVGIWDDISRVADGASRHTFVSDTSMVDGVFLAFAQKLEHPIEISENGNKFTHLVFLKNIESLKDYYTTESYGGNAATYIIKENGTLAYYDANDADIIGARNVFKALEEADYVQGGCFGDINELLRKNGIVAADIILNETEYYYCLTTLEGYNMTLMMLLPAEYVAVSTMSMMNSTIRVGIMFMSILAAMMLLGSFSFMNLQRSNQQVKVEQKNNLELNRLRLAAEDALYAAEVANKAKTTFLNNMSHDIRTPMNAIIGFTNIAMKKNPNTEVRSCLEKIGESSEHLLTLINDVLDISRIESGKMKFAPVPVDITAVTDTVMSILQGFLSNRNIVLRTNLATIKTPFVMADAVRIREVLMNILSNAVKFTEDGGTIDFESSYHPGKDEKHIVVRYRIADTGVGMSEEFVEHIFDEFAQEEDSARTQYKGTGLGMAITKRYIDLMGGTICVASKKGEGSIFTVELPLEITDESKVNNQEIPVTKVNLSNLNILMAEDNDLNAEIAMVQLEDMGIKVTRVIDGKEAVMRFEENPEDTFDLILMDIMMPVMNGFEATKAIRTMNNRPDARSIPIIAMTANAFAEDVQASLEAGMDDHIAKPIVMDEVIKAISRNVNK